MDKNKANVPKIRFPGFNNSWEQRKLKQLANFAKGQGYSKNDLTDVGTPIILYGRLYTKYQSSISEVDTFAVPRSGSVYSTGEEVIVPASGETAEDIARASAVVKSGFLLGGDLNIIYPNKDINTIFLALSISNGKQQKELSKKAQGKSVVHLHNSDLEEVTISFPCKEEQKKIESVFAHLDNLITLHQRKLNHLQDKKKSLLQKMFPKKGEDFPELRFPEFTDPWEQRKLGEVSSIIMGQSPDGSTYSDTQSDYILVQGNADLKNGWVTPRVWTSVVTKKAEAGDLIMSVRAPAGEMGKTAYDVVIGRGVAAIKGNEFIFQSLVKMNLNGYWRRISCGSTFESLNSNNIKNAEIMIPIYDEQQKIGHFFQNLDILITLHQRKLNHLQEQKKALLQQMFI